MKNIIFLISLFGYLFLESLEPVFNFIKRNTVSIFVVLFLVTVFAFPGISDYSDGEFILFFKILCIFYLLFRILIVQAKKNEHDYHNIDDQYYVKDEDYYKKVEELQYNGLSKKEIDNRKKKIRKKLEKINFI